MSTPFDYGAPTSVPHVLDALLGAKVVRLTRYSYATGDDVVNDPTYSDLAIKSRDVFAYTAGPLLIELDSGVHVAADGNDTDWGSVILWFERDAQGNKIENPLREDADFYPIDACDPVFSDSEACATIGRTIRSVIVLMGEENISRPKWPCESAVRLIMDNDHEIVLCHRLGGGVDFDFSVRTKSRIPSGYIENLKEVFRKSQ